MSKNRIFLYAYDKINLGDDLFIRTIASRYKNTKIYFLTNKENKLIFQDLKNIKIINKDSYIFKILSKIKYSIIARYLHYVESKCDASVYIGGSIFIEYPEWEKQVEWFDYKVNNYKLYILGANFGPYSSKDYKNSLKEVFYKTRDICFRDKYSVSLFEDNKKVRYAPDILFSYHFETEIRKEKQIFISIIDCKGDKTRQDILECGDVYISNIVTAIKKFITEGYTVVLASFCKEEGDEIALDTIIEMLDCKDKGKIRDIRYNGCNSNEILSNLLKSEYILATRFHAVILALVARIPVLPIIYSDKTKNVLEDINFKGVVFDIRNKQQWSYEDLYYNWNHPFYISNKLKLDAEKHFYELDKIFYKK